MCEAEYGISTSTTTLRHHLTGTHNSVYTSNKQKQATPYTLAEQKHITVNLAQWISVDLQPFSVVERVEFQQFIHTLDSRYTIPEGMLNGLVQTTGPILDRTDIGPD